MRNLVPLRMAADKTSNAFKNLRAYRPVAAAGRKPQRWHIDTKKPSEKISREKQCFQAAMRLGIVADSFNLFLLPSRRSIN